MNFTTLEYLEIRALGPGTHAPAPLVHSGYRQTQVIVPPGAVRTGGMAQKRRSAR
jgi:hypothetical protein